MKAFRYKLERILSLRKNREREWEARLAVVTGECVSLRRAIEDRADRKVRELHERDFELPDAELLRVSHLYMARLDQELAKNRVSLAAAERKREDVQASYLEASRDRKVLDKLKEKRSEDYLHEQRVEEHKELDDINTSRAARRGYGVG